MTEPRLHRRLTLLRGKRHGAFDHDQYYLEGARRARVARKARCYLRDGRPLVVSTPRWSHPRSFLDDLAVDLSLGQPSLRCRTLSLRPLEGCSLQRAWSWLVHALRAFTHNPSAAPRQVVQREGFRHGLAQLFREAEGRQRCCLLIHGLEHLHIEALHDLVATYDAHVREHPGTPALNVVFAGSFPSSPPEVHGAEHLFLDDHEATEAVEALVEHHGPEELAAIRAVVREVGGVPEVLAVLSQSAPTELRAMSTDPRLLWHALGALGTEIREAFDIVAAEPDGSARLEQLAQGPVGMDPQRDRALLTSGLVRVVGAPRSRHAAVTAAPWVPPLRVELRSPMFADLAAVFA